MASSKEYLEFILGQLSELEEITYRAMMGEFIIYYRGKIVGGIYDDRLLVKQVKSAISYMPTASYELPYEGAKEMLLVDEVEQQKKPFIFRCVNRLDRDTSGLTIIAKHVVSAAILSSMNARREIHREYRAIVRGHLTPESGVITAPLGRKDSSIIERTVDFDHGEKAVTYYQFLEEKNGHSLVSLRLGTGRTHQIRIHMKYIGFPLIGDYLYNPDMEHITRQALHSYRLTFLHPITGQKMDFTAPLPDDMKKILN